MARGFNYAAGASVDVERVQNPELDRDQLTEFAASRNPVVRERLAERTDLPLRVSVSLAHDTTTDVRLALAANPTVPEAILEHLAEDRQRTVVREVARNPRTPRPLLERLAEHRRPEVRDAARESLDSDPAAVSPPSGSGG